MKHRCIALFLVAVAAVHAAPLGAPHNPEWENLPEEDQIEITGDMPQWPAQAPQSDQPTVDQLVGNKSVRFGAPLASLAPRLRVKRSGKQVLEFAPSGTYVLRQLYSGEETYGGYPVQTKVVFTDGYVSGLELMFLTKDAAAFAKAFEAKYGAPNAGAFHWRGKDVDYRIDTSARGGVFVYITSLKVQRDIQQSREFAAQAKEKKVKPAGDVGKDF